MLTYADAKMLTYARFEGFYQMHFDHTPEVCTGAVAKTALQAMLLQC
jgi:hypothetical protein